MKTTVPLGRLSTASAAFLISVFLITVVSRWVSQPHGSERWAPLIDVNDYAGVKSLELSSRDIESLRDQLVAAGFPAKQAFLLSDNAKESKYCPFRAKIGRQLHLVLGLVAKEALWWSTSATTASLLTASARCQRFVTTSTASVRCVRWSESGRIA
jgi:hypothetical protein